MMSSEFLQFMTVGGGITATIALIIGMRMTIKSAVSTDYTGKQHIDHEDLALGTVMAFLWSACVFFIWPFIVGALIIYGIVLLCVKGPHMIKEREAKKLKSIEARVRSQMRELDRLARDADELGMPETAKTNRMIREDLRKSLEFESDDNP